MDDLHWWDEASSTLLSAAIDGIGESRVLLVTAGRPEAWRAALVSSASTVHLELDPLTAAQVEELVLGIASLPAEPWAESFAADLWRASRGSPLLALGMLRFLEERSLLVRSNGSWASSRPAVLRVELQQGDVFRTRLAELERAEVWLLTLLATGGSAVPRDVLAQAFADNAGRVEFEVVHIRQAGWSPQDTRIPVRWQGPRILLQSGNTFAADYDSNSATMITSQAVSDSGVIDRFLCRPGQPARRFLPAIRDDGDPRFSPDGKAVVFTTARWDTLFRYDLAIASLEDSAAIPLTRGPTSDVAPHWSPDGSRIAFARSTWGDGPNEICVAERPSRKDQVLRPVCVPSEEPGSYMEPMGWLDNDRLIVWTPTTVVSQLSIMQCSSGVMTPFIEVGRGTTILSPDASWLLCTCVLAANGSRTLGLTPISAPSLVRPMRQTSSDNRLFLNAFWRSSSASLKPATVRIENQTVVTAGVPAKMRASLLDSRGTALSPRISARWRLDDPAAGTIDSRSGIFVASESTSSIAVHAYATTGIADSLTIPVDRDSARMVLDERWDDLDGWWRYGIPRSELSASATGESQFLPNGDGSFDSGAVARGTVNPTRGTALEADIWSPITGTQWQSIHVALRRVSDTTNYAAESDDNSPPRLALDAEPCGFGYPSEGRLVGRTEIGGFATTSGTLQHTVPGISAGRRWRLRLQLFPDGRCGVAVDGKPIAIVDGGEPSTAPLHAAVEGGSYGTRIAVGPLRMYEGVLRDIDWSNVPVLR